ncbi:IBR domain-containing protein [Metarhizium robertsii ARSEF 23]|nr:IBR domain-containing protein [Metarhizium robertsii ARSEF 23]KHO11098.1 IBR domain-containing protein [Metarhizium robertsii ARSEF 23]
MEADRKVETERPNCSVCAVAEYNFYSEVFGIPCPQCGECLTLAFYKSHLIVCHQDEFFVAHICSECENKIWECTQYASFGSEAWGQNENYADYTESTLKHRDTVESVLTESNAYEAIADPSQSQRKAPRPVFHTTKSDDLFLRLREEFQSWTTIHSYFPSCKLKTLRSNCSKARSSRSSFNSDKDSMLIQLRVQGMSGDKIAAKMKMNRTILSKRHRYLLDKKDKVLSKPAAKSICHKREDGQQMVL